MLERRTECQRQPAGSANGRGGRDTKRESVMMVMAAMAFGAVMRRCRPRAALALCRCADGRCSGCVDVGGTTQQRLLLDRRWLLLLLDGWPSDGGGQLARRHLDGCRIAAGSCGLRTAVLQPCSGDSMLRLPCAGRRALLWSARA